VGSFPLDNDTLETLSEVAKTFVVGINGSPSNGLHCPLGGKIVNG
jgi:hypothetical protein